MHSTGVTSARSSFPAGRLPRRFSAGAKPVTPRKPSNRDPGPTSGAVATQAAVRVIGEGALSF